MDHKISVQICCYNSEKYLDATIKSVVGQSFKDWELVIVNDGSTDGSEKIIKKYLDMNLPINYFYQKNKGFAVARNKALGLSRGEWIAILDHDDLWYPMKLQIQSESIKKYPDIKMHFSNSEWFTDGGEILKKNIEGNRFKTGLISDAFYKLIGEGCFIDSETVVINKQALIDCGGFDERYKYIVDYDAFLRLAKRYNTIYYENEVLSKWRVHSLQASELMKDTMFREHAELLDSATKNCNLPKELKRVVSNTIASNRLKYSLSQLRKGELKSFFTTLPGPSTFGSLMHFVYSKALKTLVS